jgi:hypothetical protein
LELELDLELEAELELDLELELDFDCDKLLGGDCDLLAESVSILHSSILTVKFVDPILITNTPVPFTELVSPGVLKLIVYKHTVRLHDTTVYPVMSTL